jgi:ABC-type thiamin/hydroxymethylpyrimidine transport system permease subunit
LDVGACISVLGIYSHTIDVVSMEMSPGGQGGNQMKCVSVLILALLSIFFGWLFYERYWKFRDCISQALSSCLTPDGDNLTQGGSLWAGLAGLFLLVAVISARRVFRSRDAGK